MMKMWVAVVGVLALTSRSFSTNVVPGVRSMPAGRDTGEERIYFPTDDFTDNFTDTLDLDGLDRDTLKRLNIIENISDFAQMFNLSLPENDSPNATVVTRFGDVGDEPAELATMANCKPELRTVELDLPHDSHTTFYPTCIRVEQCGGCCFGPLLTCRPTVTKAFKVKVLKTSTSRGSSRRGRPDRRHRRENTVSYHTVSVFKHTACECGCKVQASDCNTTIHTYHEGECACVCKDRDEKSKCEEQNSTKYWSDESCSCYCRKPLSCGSGEYFSQVSCRCEHLAVRSGIIFSDLEEHIRERGRWANPTRTPWNRINHVKPVRVPT